MNIDLDKGNLTDISQDFELSVGSLPRVMQELLNAGGAVNYYKKYSRLPVLSKMKETGQNDHEKET